MTGQPTWPDHLLSLDEWAALPEETERRYELVEPGPPVVLTEFRSTGDAYEMVAEHRGTAPLRLGVTIDLDALG